MDSGAAAGGGIAPDRSVLERVILKRALKIGRKWLYIGHRWLGIAACILFVAWFASGLVMMYVPYPSVTERERLSALETIEWAQVRVDPTSALKASGVTAFPTQFRLQMMAGQPVYRIVQAQRRWTVSARDGQIIEAISPAVATTIARRFSRGAAIREVATIERDQWTVAGGFNPHRPLHRIRLADAAGTQLYVSSTTGEVVQNSTRGERFWNWLGSIPHWIYLTSIRTDVEVWRQVIMWTSGGGIIGAVTGVWIGILRLRLKRRYHGHEVSPYQGWMKWHHIGGLITGLILTTWIFSGWLSVNPFNWFARSSPDTPALVRYAGQREPLFEINFPRLRAATEGARDVRFVWVDGRALVVVSGADGSRTLLDSRTAAPAGLTDPDLFHNARSLMPDRRVISAARLTEEDIYWYGHHSDAVLPVLRVQFDDPPATWFHIDPLTGQVLGSLNRSDRTERWLFNFLHDFDLPVLLHSRPVWDILVWALSAGGLIISVSGVVIGWRRLKYKTVHARRRRRRSPVAQRPNS